MADSTTTRLHMTLGSSLGSVQTMEETAEAWARMASFDEDAAANVSISVREAMINAVIHAHGSAVDREIQCSFELTTESLVIRVADGGAGLDAAALPDPLAPENILRSSGRGVFLMRALMDEVQFRDLHPGTEVTLIKKRTGPETHHIVR